MNENGKQEYDPVELWREEEYRRGIAFVFLLLFIGAIGIFILL